MKNKRKTMIAIATALLVVSLIVAASFLGEGKLKEPTLHERQVEFLKKHENEMAIYIKKRTSQKEKIVFHWDTVESSQSMAFSDKVLIIRFDIVDESRDSSALYRSSGNKLVIHTDVNKLDRITKLAIASQLHKSEKEK